MDIEQVRNAFSTWYWANIPDENKQVFEAAWEAWKAARAQLPASAPSVSVDAKGMLNKFAWACWHGSTEDRKRHGDEILNAIQLSETNTSAHAGLLSALKAMVDCAESNDFDGAPSDAALNAARAAIQRAEASKAQPAAPTVPDVLFDGYAVLQALSERAKTRTSAENVSDTLDAIVKILRTEQPSGELGKSAEQEREREPLRNSGGWTPADMEKLQPGEKGYEP
jgi:hypothetical protein